MEKIKDNLPIFSVALLILGTVNLLVYYSFFHVDILSYLDFTEVLQIQFRLFAIAVAVIFGQIAYTVMSVHLIQKITVMTDTKSKVNIFFNKINAWLLKRIGKISINAQIIMFMTFVFMLCIVLSINTPKMLYMYLLIFSILLLLLIIKLFYNAFKKEVLNENFRPEIDTIVKSRIEFEANLKLLKTILGFIFLTYISVVTAIISAINTVLYSASNEVTLITDKVSFSTSYNYRFIGKTKNFTFFYNIPLKQAEVFPNGDIKKLYLRDGMRYEHKQDSLYHFNFTRNGIREWFDKANRQIR